MSATASSSKVPTVGNDMYEIRQIERKGQGMVAAKDLSPGDVILVEQPMVVINVEGVNTTIGAKTVYKQYLDLSKEDRGRFDTLTFHADSHAIAAFAKRCGKEQDKERGRSVARFNTNCMENQASTMRYVAIEAARINHSCSPNTTYEYFDKDNVVAVRALQKIAKAEEILIQYIPPVWSKAKRQAKLWQDWGFICACQACTSHPYGVVTEKVGDELQHADRQLRDIRNRGRKAGTNPNTIDPREQIKWCKFIVQRTVSIRALIPDTVAKLEIYLRLLELTGQSASPEAKKWYGEAYRLTLICRGPDDKVVMHYADMLETFPSAG